MIKWVTFIMCINYRIHHEHNMALQSAAGCPLNSNFAANADELQAQQYGDFTDYVLALSGKPVFVKASMNAAIGNPMSAVCKRASQQSRLSDRPRPVASDYPNLSPHAVLTSDAGSALAVRRGQSRICLKSRPAGNAPPRPRTFA